MRQPRTPELRARMRRAVETLPPGPREVYRLNAIEGLDLAAVAARLGIETREAERLLAEAIYLIGRHFDGGAHSD